MQRVSSTVADLGRDDSRSSARPDREQSLTLSGRRVASSYTGFSTVPWLLLKYPASFTFCRHDNKDLSTQSQIFDQKCSDWSRSKGHLDQRPVNGSDLSGRGWTWPLDALQVPLAGKLSPVHIETAHCTCGGWGGMGAQDSKHHSAESAASELQRLRVTQGP